MFKRAKVVMFPTKEKAVFFISKEHPEIAQKGDNSVINPNWIGQHLYFLSDDEIKESDWYYTPSKRSIEQCVKKLLIIKGGSSDIEQKKIIATTDESLLWSKETECLPSLPNQLPQPSQSFIKKYIEEYNKGNIITDVMVEYEEYDWSLLVNGHIVLHERLKIAKDNTITIKKIKDSWSRDEIESILKDYSLWLETNEENFFSAHIWINENL